FLVEGLDDPTSAGRLADRVQRELAQPFGIAGQEVFTSASIGISLRGASDQRPEDLLRDADTAMYRAKAEGIARQAVFDVTMHDEAVAALQLQNDLRRAVDRGELRVRYQPIVALQSARIVGFEALVRWQHRQRGLVGPQEFIPLAEETGVIGSSAVGYWPNRAARCARSSGCGRADRGSRSRSTSRAARCCSRIWSNRSQTSSRPPAW